LIFSKCFGSSKIAQIPKMLRRKAGGTGQDGLPSDALNVGINFLGMMAQCDQHKNGQWLI
jgi:hypothetical protein